MEIRRQDGVQLLIFLVIGRSSAQHLKSMVVGGGQRRLEIDQGLGSWFLLLNGSKHTTTDTAPRPGPSALTSEKDPII